MALKYNFVTDLTSLVIEEDDEYIRKGPVEIGKIPLPSNQVSQQQQQQQQLYSRPIGQNQVSQQQLFQSYSGSIGPVLNNFGKVTHMLHPNPTF